MRRTSKPPSEPDANCFRSAEDAVRPLVAPEGRHVDGAGMGLPTRTSAMDEDPATG